MIARNVPAVLPDDRAFGPSCTTEMVELLRGLAVTASAAVELDPVPVRVSWVVPVAEVKNTLGKSP